MRVLVTIGTRPEAIKMAPVVHALYAAGLDCQVCLTGQHRELLDQVIRTFALRVDHDLNLMRPGQHLGDLTAAVLQGMRPVLAQVQPDLVLVHGDTTTTFAAALAAYYERIPVGHVEAGLRTGLRYEPFPEELNRRLADTLSHWCYAATDQARDNLLREGRDPAEILVTGNTVIDALLSVANQPFAFTDPLLEELGSERRLVLITAHRRESFGQPLRNIFDAIKRLVARHADIEVIYPVHPNPHVLEAARMLEGIERIHLVAPLDYAPFIHLLKKCCLVLSDSGGIQEEAPSLNVPLLVLRDATERPEVLEAGAAALVGTDSDRIVREAQRLLEDPAAYAGMASASNPFGDGRAAERIAAHVAGLAS